MSYTKYNYWQMPFAMINGYHSYYYYGLVLVSTKVNPPKLKTLKFSTFYSDGDIDETDSVRSKKRFTNQTVTMNFKIIDPKAEWSLINNLVKRLNGENAVVYISTEKTWYTGRLQVNPFQTSRLQRIVSITLDASPISQVPAYYKEYTYKFGIGKTVTKAVTGMSLQAGDTIYARTDGSFYVTVPSISSAEKLCTVNGLYSIGTATESGSIDSVIIRTTSTSATILDSEHSIDLMIGREKNGW